MRQNRIHQPPDEERIDRRGRRQRRLYAFVAAWAILVCAGGCIAWYYPPAPAFGTVVSGVLYRSGQPGADALRVLQRRYGIRTVVNLRSPIKLENDALAQQEIAFARGNDMKFVNLPYGGPSPATEVEEFLAIVSDPANRPVLVHCAAGKDRAGVMVAAYRIRKQGWSLSKALEEMKSLGFEPEKKPDMLRVVEKLAQMAKRYPETAEYEHSHQDDVE